MKNVTKDMLNRLYNILTVIRLKIIMFEILKNNNTITI